MSTASQDALRSFLSELNVIAETHQEVTDTDVREAMHRTLNRHLVWGHARDRMPKSYGMFSAEGDRLVAGAVERYLEAMDGEAAPVGPARLALVQDATVRSAAGHMFDDFLGSVEAPLADEPLPEFWYRDEP